TRFSRDWSSDVCSSDLIVPTLSHAHITPEALTPEPRYRQLYDLRKALKGNNYEYRINGVDELLTRDNIALFAGCVTSFQTHYQIDRKSTRLNSSHVKIS